MMKSPSRVFVIVLRILAAVAAFAAAIVMVTSHDSTTFFNITMDAKFQYTPAFKFLVVANVIVGIYTVIALFVPPASPVSRLIVATDVIAAMLLTASLSAAGSIGYVGKKGSEHAGWLPVCDQIPKFCDQTMGAIICNFVGVLTYTVIVFHNIHKSFDPFYKC